MRTCIVNYASGTGHCMGQRRLVASLEKHGYTGDLLLYGDEHGNSLPPGCPKHSEVPYAFKTYGMVEAVRRGATLPMWMDASMWITSRLDPILDYAREHGAASWLCGFSVADWTHDTGLARMGITREQARSIPLIVGGLVAISTEHPAGRELLDRWHGFASDGESFVGSWNNHRHDMPSLSYLIHKLGIPPIGCPKWFAYDSNPPQKPDPISIVLARGM